MSHDEGKLLITWPVIALMLLIAVGLALMGLWDGRYDRVLTDHGVKAKADIERVDWMTNRDSDRNYRFVVSFATLHGRARESVSVSRSVGERARHDDSFKRVNVIYLPEDHSVVRVVGSEHQATWIYLAGAFALLMAFALLALRYRMNADAEARPAPPAFGIRQ